MLAAPANVVDAAPMSGAPLGLINGVAPLEP